jgi:hypothetical protein
LVVNLDGTSLSSAEMLMKPEMQASGRSSLVRFWTRPRLVNGDAFWMRLYTALWMMHYEAERWGLVKKYIETDWKDLGMKSRKVKLHHVKFSGLNNALK